MGEVSGSVGAIEAHAAGLARPVAGVREAASRVESAASAYLQAESTIPRREVRVPAHLDDAVAWVADLAEVMRDFAAGLVEADDRAASWADRAADVADLSSDTADALEAALYLGLTRWGDVRRYSAARLQAWRLNRRLTTAADFGATGLPRRDRRAMMRRHNRPLTNQLRKLRGKSNAARASVARGRGGAWTHVRTVTGRVADRFPRTASVARAGGRVLAVAGVALSANDVVFGVRDGDAEQVGLGVAGLGAAAAFAAGGPVGIAVGVTLVAGSLAWENREALARMGREAFDGLTSLGTSAVSNVADAVSDVGEAVDGVVDSAAGVVSDAASGLVSTVGGWFD